MIGCSRTSSRKTEIARSLLICSGLHGSVVISSALKKLMKFPRLLLWCAKLLSSIRLLQKPRIIPASSPISSVSLGPESTFWSCPSIGWVKLNTDAVSKGNPGLSGGGGLFRDHLGSFLSAFCFFHGDSLALSAELQALLLGLQLAVKLGFPRIVVMDSLAAVQLIQAQHVPTRRDYFLIDNCRRLIAGNPWEVQICHVRRSANKAADSLANHSLISLNPYVEFSYVPDFLSPFLAEDNVAHFEQN